MTTSTNEPNLPPQVDWPRDREDAPMLFVGEIDLSRQSNGENQLPAQGSLLIFVSKNWKQYPAKDQKGFKIVFLPEPGHEPLPAAELGVLTKDPNSERAKIVAAFAANGISYSEARRNDNHYAHLLQAAAKWRPLFRLTAPFECHLLINEEDLQAGRLDKSWLIANA